MQGKDAIIEKILGDANAQANSIVNDANVYAEKLIAETKANLQKIKASTQAQAEKNCEEYIARRLTVAELDIKKINLSAKKQVIDSVFDEANKAIKKLKPAEYKKLITNMLLKSAEDGDIVTISKADKSIISAEFIEEFAKKQKIKLKLDKKFGDFSGGFILHGKDMDKNLTFEVELKVLKENYENQVAKILFGEVK